MARKDNASIQVRKSQKEDFRKLAKERKTTQTKLFGDLMLLARAKVGANTQPLPIIEAADERVQETIIAPIIPEEEGVEAPIIAEVIG